MAADLMRGAGALGALAVAFVPAAALAQGYAEPGQLGMQPSVTAIMDSIRSFHDGVLLWTITFIVLLVLALLVWVIIRFNAKANPRPSATTHNSLVEIAWTVIPIVILIIIAIPSFGVLSDQLTMPDGERRYLGSNIFSWGEVELPPPGLTIKVTGEQWYWNYEYVDQAVSFDSNMYSDADRQALKPGQPRLLAVDNELVVPVNTTVRVQVTASPVGVMHAFGIPSFGILIDAVPGRLNETWFNARETGIYYGQCRELCGKDHAYMPIAVRVVSQEEFTAWVDAFQTRDLAAATATLPPVQ